MPMMEWSDKLAVGVPSIDAQHKQLVGMANDLYIAIKAGHGKDLLDKTLDGLIGYTVTHFDYEEQLFDRTGYAFAVQHKKEHEELKKQVAEIQQKMKGAASFDQSMQVMDFLRKWLLNHIMRLDKAYGPHLTAKGIE